MDGVFQHDIVMPHGQKCLTLVGRKCTKYNPVRKGTHTLHWLQSAWLQKYVTTLLTLSRQIQLNLYKFICEICEGSDGSVVKVLCQTSVAHPTYHQIAYVGFLSKALKPYFSCCFDDLFQYKGKKRQRKKNTKGDKKK